MSGSIMPPAPAMRLIMQKIFGAGSRGCRASACAKPEMRRGVLTCLAAALSACASPGAGYEQPKPAAYETPQAEFEILKRRLIRTAAGLMRANAGLCPNTRVITTPAESFEITHPAGTQRMTRLHMAILEVERLQSAGAPLRPI